MTNAELNKFRIILETKKADLARVLRNRDEIAIEKSPDAIDEVTRAAERELAIRNLDRESTLLRNVNAALIRIREGSYGICAHCEEPISPKRLQAVPWAPFCISCQEAVDRNESDAVEALEDLLVNAA
jgi:DnaK suppressor protein